MAKTTTGKPHQPHRAIRLWQQAEEFLRTSPRDIGAMSAEAIQVLVHELQVYQVELEMQNEELRRVQYELEESRSLYQDLFDCAPVGYLNLDHEGRVERANLTIAGLLGVDRAQLQGAPLARFVVPDDQDILYLHRQAVKDTDSHVCELRIQPEQGKQQDVRLETRVVREKTEGTPAYWMVLINITERKQMEEALQRAHDELETQVDTRTAELQEANASLQTEITERTRMEEELRMLNAELEQRVNNRTTELQTSERDLRQLSQEQQQLLIASDRLVSLGELAASLAHEFNNPLGIAMGFAQDLLSEADPTDPFYRRLQIIESQTRRCSQLLKELTDLAQPLQAHRIPTDLAVLVRRSLDLVSGRLRQHKIATQLDLDAQLDPIAVDPQQLEQVLLNIYFNAVEAMPDGGTLSVCIWKHRPAGEATREASAGPELGLPDEPTRPQEQSEVRIAVTDTGIGIAPDDHTQILRPFFTTKKQRGMGLGLSICDSIMRAHSGRISIDSTPGQGSTVLLHLPLDPPVLEKSHDNTTRAYFSSR